LCVQQLGELQKSATALQAEADVYTINRDPPAQTAQVRQLSGTTLPILYDEKLEVAGQYDFLPKPGQPMGGMSGIPQMGFVIIDSQGIIRAQRVDIYFGQDAGQMLEILEALTEG
jgi:peroxiredoxin